MSAARRALPPVDKYLVRYAAPEHALARALDATYARVLCVPAWGERADFLDGYRAAIDVARGRTLVIVVVNAPEGGDARLSRASVELCRDFARGARPVEADGARAWLVERERSDVLVVDRASTDRRLPRRQAVGLARRIGADVALALWTAGRAVSPFIASSDADAELPATLFACADAPREPAAALLFPFVHAESGDAALDEATAIYDASLRYYVLGLARAGSPYAYHSLGSALAVDAAAYAAVRGFPKRAAAEDFYLQDKLAKVGALERVRCDPIRVRARRSERVPFGTGRGVAKIEAERAAGREPRFYHPEVFSVLATWLSALDDFAETRDLARVHRVFETSAPRVRDTLAARCDDAALEQASRAALDPRTLRRRLHTRFDALATLQLVHALSESALERVEWRVAITSFVGVRDAQRASAAELSALLRAREAELPARVGPALIG
jgi:hypothetical protein